MGIVIDVRKEFMSVWMEYELVRREVEEEDGCWKGFFRDLYIWGF